MFLSRRFLFFPPVRQLTVLTPLPRYASTEAESKSPDTESKSPDTESKSPNTEVGKQEEITEEPRPKVKKIVPPFKPISIGNPLYPFFSEKSKYPGVRPAPLPDSKIDYPIMDFHTRAIKGTVPISRKLFNAPLRTDILHRVVVWQLDAARQGTASAKTRAEVRGGGRKPWKQKGTGRARIGSIRAPHWRGGGVAFPPKPRDFSTKLPHKLQLFGLRVALSTKLAQAKLVVVEDVVLESHKTKEFTPLLAKEWGKVLIVSTKGNEFLEKASANIPTVNLTDHTELNVYDILKHETLMMTKKELELLERRIEQQSLGQNSRELLLTEATVKLTKRLNANTTMGLAYKEVVEANKKATKTENENEGEATQHLEGKKIAAVSR